MGPSGRRQLQAMKNDRSSCRLSLRTAHSPSPSISISVFWVCRVCVSACVYVCVCHNVDIKYRNGGYEIRRHQLADKCGAKRREGAARERKRRMKLKSNRQERKERGRQDRSGSDQGIAGGLRDET
jgi:hypothetical protein